jgi:hypothetical protein
MVYLSFIYLRDLLTFYLSSQIQVHDVRIVQLTSRTTSVMTVSEVGELSAFDPVLNAFRVLGQLYNLAVSQPRWYKRFSYDCETSASRCTLSTGVASVHNSW